MRNQPGFRARNCYLIYFVFSALITLAVSTSFDTPLPLWKKASKGQQDDEEPGSKLLPESERSLYSPEQEGDIHKMFKAAMEQQAADHKKRRWPAGPSKRIINGDLAPKDSYPWFVLLFDELFYPVCGGFLVSPQFVFTAAHCMVSGAYYESPPPLRYAAVGIFCVEQEGEFDNCGQKYELFDFGELDQFPSALYNPVTIEHDFALIKLNGTSTIEPVEIDDGRYSERYQNATDKLWTLGFGIDEIVDGEPVSAPANLKHVEQSYVPNDQCDSDFAADPDFMLHITSDMMCAEGPDDSTYAGACWGDSGGPLYDRESDVVVGVVSWGYDCENPAFPSVFGRISSTFVEAKMFICSIDQDATICSHSQSPSVSPMPTKTLSASPSEVPSISQSPSQPPPTCRDYPNWTDFYQVGCDTYELLDDPGCPRFGNSFAGDKGVANDACCYCGGGINTCTDYPDWTDIDGDNCTWYEANDRPGCPFNGNDFEGEQGVANDACCYCGGGDNNGTFAPTPASYNSSCTDYPGWTDIAGDDCTWYELGDSPGCPELGDKFEGDQGVANDACCYCGGGINGTLAPTLSASPSQAPSNSSCTDYLNWTDVFGDDCTWYENNERPGCPINGHDFEVGDQGVANDACCYCGGGIYDTISPTKAPLSAPTHVPRTRAPAFAVCSDSEATFQLDIKFDGHSHDISWILTRVCTGSLIEMRSYESGETSDFYSKCMPIGRYNFELFDSHGDGFSHPSGRAIVSYSVGDEGKVEFVAEGDFGSSVELVFGKGDAMDME